MLKNTCSSFHHSLHHSELIQVQSHYYSWNNSVPIKTQFWAFTVCTCSFDLNIFKKQQQCEHRPRSSDRLTTESLSTVASPGVTLTDPRLLILLCSAASLASWCYPAGSHRSSSMVTDWGHSFHSSLTLWDPAAQELPSGSSNSPHTQTHRGLAD